MTPPPVLLAVDLVILTLRNSRLHVLLVERGSSRTRCSSASRRFLNNLTRVWKKPRIVNFGEAD